MKLGEYHHPDCDSNKDADWKCDCHMAMIAKLEAEVENTFAHWHMHSHKNYLRWQKTLKRNAQLRVENKALRDELKDKEEEINGLKEEMQELYMYCDEYI